MYKRFINYSNELRSYLILALGVMSVGASADWNVTRIHNPSDLASGATSLSFDSEVFRLISGGWRQADAKSYEVPVIWSTDNFTNWAASDQSLTDPSLGTFVSGRVLGVYQQGRTTIGVGYVVDDFGTQQRAVWKNGALTVLVSDDGSIGGALTSVSGNGQDIAIYGGYGLIVDGSLVELGEVWRDQGDTFTRQSFHPKGTYTSRINGVYYQLFESFAVGSVDGFASFWRGPGNVSQLRTATEEPSNAYAVNDSYIAGSGNNNGLPSPYGWDINAGFRFRDFSEGFSGEAFSVWNTYFQTLLVGYSDVNGTLRAKLWETELPSTDLHQYVQGGDIGSIARGVVAGERIPFYYPYVVGSTITADGYENAYFWYLVR